MSTPTELYILIGVLSFFAVSGITGNLLVLYVFSQKKDKLVSTLFILVLAFVDFTTCLFVMPYTIYMECVSFELEFDFVCKLYQFLITSNIPFSSLVMVAIAIDRYFCICHPFLQAMNLRRAKIIIACLALVSTGLGIIVGLMYGVWAIIPSIQANDNHGLNIYQNDTPGNSVRYQNNNELFSHTGTQMNLNISSSTADANHTMPEELSAMYTGHCQPNELILSYAFQWLYQKLYILLYLLCLIIVIVLYSLIYHSVLARRSKRQKQIKTNIPLVIQTGERARLSSTSKADSRMSNLKMAAMLFVVTVVFIVTFLPAFLMTLELIPYSMTIFYMYFANNVANPAIYGFMNKRFRDDLRKIFCG